ncbi:MAG: hypothetical protein IPM29_13475 [Planctomycetes bacterium]|nr:hypothetical protein [Planctomycetota bacterium]
MPISTRRPALRLGTALLAVLSAGGCGDDRPPTLATLERFDGRVRIAVAAPDGATGFAGRLTFDRAAGSFTFASDGTEPARELRGALASSGGVELRAGGIPTPLDPAALSTVVVLLQVLLHDPARQVTVEPLPRAAGYRVIDGDRVLTVEPAPWPPR